MNLKHLELLRAVLSTESVTEAARRLGVSQPAVSKMLREAEQQLGGKLFDRRGGRLATRIQARPLADAIEKVLFDVERVRLLAEELQENPAPRLRIGAIPTATMTLLPRAVGRLRERYPDTRFEILALPTREILEGVAAGTLELGFVYSTQSHPAVTATELEPTEVVCAMRADHPLAARPDVQARELERHPFVSFHLDEPISLAINEGFRAAGARCSPTVLVSHSFAACGLAEQGVGVALVTPLLIASGIFSTLVVRPFSPTIRLRPLVIFARHAPLGEHAEAMVSEIRAAASLWRGTRLP
ncbi:LysR substrate-binding domain-containing protein [Falsiroseomonas sp.]|uniref:LysR substrate-binding domain-containing protein n=1 Tax=Falsiroseomonas sp. TaxID=2870721 RepID=UPI0035679D46